METSGGVLLFLLLTSVSGSAVQKLDSIQDLKKIDFGKSVPKHSLILLHWFANTVDIDNNNVIWLTFDPNNDHGSHHYGNYERIFDPLPRGFRYFTVGNLNQETSDDLPDYVVNPQRGYEGQNRDRILFTVHEQRIGQVYMTQHYSASEHQGTLYDPAHTYQVTTNLLRRVREFSLRDNQLPLVYLRHRHGSRADINGIRNEWGDHLACLGLLLFIVIKEKYSQNQRNNKAENNRSENPLPQNPRLQMPSRQVNYPRPAAYRPEAYRPEAYRPEAYRPEAYRPEAYRPKANTGELNTSQNCGVCDWLTCCFVTIVLVIIIVFLIIIFTSK